MDKKLSTCRQISGLTPEWKTQLKFLSGEKKIFGPVATKRSSVTNYI